MKRKTIEVAQLKAWINTRLEITNSAHFLGEMTPEQAFRFGQASILEQVLHATGNYRGFGYQRSEKNPAYVEGGGEQEANWLRDGHDDTRRTYY